MEIIKNILHNNQHTTNLLIRKVNKKGNNNSRIIKNSTYNVYKMVNCYIYRKTDELYYRSLRIEA
jgi:hypothetical protein